MAMYRAEVEITGTRPILFNCFSPECIPLERKEKNGVAGNNPEEWKNTYKTTDEGFLYVDGSYIHRCLINAAKFTKRGLQSTLAATLDTLTDKLVFENRKVPNQERITTDASQEVYIDIRSVKMAKTSSRHIRYRLASSIGWKTSFSILWDSSLINKELLESVCHDAGLFVGIGDNRSNGFGRFEVNSFKAIPLRNRRNA
ncbi:hypothetical protein [Cytobacillus solani]|uniref:CRISPR-associated protein n=1 Tax=Cytobacillus solani TaxID=1637975 RepID=A0A0Q3T6H3_9BACI|nr:hypothetical protein [Cytobacillus solani]KQL19085.1 hypothetical protein AN957_11145 [Cytobacillus solani]